MNLRPKTKRRLAVLLSGTLLCAALGTTGVAIQLHRHSRIRQGYRDIAMSAFNRGDYLAAMLGFKKYLSQNSADGPAIYAYAVARSEVPEPDLKHLVKAKAILARYLELNPSDSIAQHKLLDIYRRIRYDAEALSLANTLLAQNPNDVEALQAKLQAMIDEGSYISALPVSMKVNELSPLDLEAQLTTYRLLAQLKHPPAEMVARAEQMLQQHPNDPRFELLRAVAADFDGNEGDVRKWLSAAANHPLADAQFIRELSNLFERMGMFEQARALLAKSLAGIGNDPEIVALLVEREWEAGESSAALGRLTTLNPNDVRTDAHLLGLKALILYMQGSQADRARADVIVQCLSKRDGENIASAWSSLLRSHFSQPPVEPRQAVAMCRSTLHRDPQNAIAHYFLGVAYNDLGETELAVQSWRWAAKFAAPWAAPHLREARALLDSNRIDEAYPEALAARGCSGDSFESTQMLVLTGYARLGAVPSSTEINSLLDLLGTIRKEHPGDAESLPVYVGLLARSGRMAEALQNATDSLSPAVPPQVLLHLAQVSSAEHLGIEPAIADVLEQITPATATIALDRALVLAMLGERAEGLQSLTTARDTAGADRMSWELAIARYRESIGDRDLGPVWTSLAEGAPKELPVQRAVLQSTSAWSDRKLIDGTIDRVKSLTGDECLTWRLARARLNLLSEDDAKGNAGAAAAMMADVVRMAPDLAEAQFLWAKALNKLGDHDGAIERLRIAAMLAPSDRDINERLADRLQLSGRDDEARGALETLAQNHSITAADQVGIARKLWQLGQSEAAVHILDSPLARSDEPDRDLLLAQIDQSEGKIEDASHIYTALMTTAAPTDAAIQAAAWFTAWRGDTVGGLRMLDRPIDNRELTLARFDEAFASPDAAIVHYQAAVSAVPLDLFARKALAGFQLRRGKFDLAEAAAEAGLKDFPHDPDLMAINTRAKTFAAVSTTPAMKSLIAAFSVQPNDEAIVQTLDAVVQPLADQESPEQFLSRLRDVADIFPRFIPAQTLLAEQYSAAGHVKQAEEIAERAVRAAPVDAEPAKELAMLYAGAEQWDKELDAARRWRARTLDRPEFADVQIADAQLHLHDAAAAVARITPYLTQIKLSPNQNIDMVRIYTQALIESRRSSEAHAILDPLVSQSPRWRLIWLDVGINTAPDVTTAQAWIEKVSPQMLTTGGRERLALAQEWYDAGLRFNDSALFAKASIIAQPLADSPNPNAEALILMGNVAMQSSDAPAAERDFRQAVKIDPMNATGLADLAGAIGRHEGDLNQARQFAEQAIAIAPANGHCRDTLASIDAKTGNLKAAINGFESALEMNAADSEAMIALADVQLRSGQREQAAATLDQLMALLKNEIQPSTAIQRRIDAVRLALRTAPVATSITDLKQ